MDLSLADRHLSQDIDDPGTNTHVAFPSSRGEANVPLERCLHDKRCVEDVLRSYDLVLGCKVHAFRGVGHVPALLPTIT